MAVPKTTHNHIQPLLINGKRILIPPKTFIVPSLLAVHTHPDYWPEPLSWKPSRWIVLDKTDKQEILYVPQNGIYFPWSDGPQFCLGKKFTQVEFIAVIACLFNDHHVHPFLEKGETEESGRKRALAVCEDSEHVLLLRMRDGDSIKLVWEKVEKSL